MAKFSLAWDTHKQNICDGLTALQQNGEFVDMTLAADGHHVKVHKMVISLSSPYLKDIITSFQNPHPVIFLNKISFTILSAILEYIYTGEVMIEKDSLMDLVEAAKELHIIGLQDLQDANCELVTEETSAKSMISKEPSGQSLPRRSFPLVPSGDDEAGTHGSKRNQRELVSPLGYENDDPLYQDMHPAYEDSEMNEETREGIDSDSINDSNTKIHDKFKIRTPMENIGKSTESKDEKVPAPNLQLQYTLSNVGSIQLILNRYIYNVRYKSKKGPQGHKLWRCVDFPRGKCRAAVITKEGVVVKRFSVHNHPFHDQKILKKVQNGLVFSSIPKGEMMPKKEKKISQLDSKEKSISISIRQ